MLCCPLRMPATTSNRATMGCQCADLDSRSDEASEAHRSAATVLGRNPYPHAFLDCHRGLPLLLLLLLLFALGLPVSGKYSFDDIEIAGTADVSLPLPRPFDATACSFHHLAQQQKLLLALQQLQHAKSRPLIQDAQVEALIKASLSGLITEEAERFIKFGRQAEISVKLKFTNRGKSPVSSVFILLPYSEATQLGWITASGQKGKQLEVQSVLPPLPSISTLRWEDWGLRPLLLEQTEHHLKSASDGGGNSFVSPCWPHIFRLQLQEALPVSESTTLTVSYVLGRPYRPVPRTLDLESIQSVLFATSSNWPLPYKTLRSTLSLQLPPQTTLGEEGERHMSQKSFRKLPGEMWKWESTDPIDPLEIMQPFAVIFPLPQHLGYVLTMERLLVVPLSGTAVCKDLYKVHNDAALQEGAFNPVTIALLQGLPPGISRLAAKGRDVPRSERVPTHVLFDLHATLPPDVFNLDVGDSAGNLTSTFASRYGPQGARLSTHLEVWPRFPVLGGWNFDLKVSYDMPVSSLILQHGVNGGKISLNIPLGPPFQDLYAEYISLTVALPTGAINIRYSSTVEFEYVEETTVKWWLDVVTSRPALRLKWHSASLPPTEHKGHYLTVTFDYPYSVDLEHLKKAFILFLLLLIATISTVLYHWKLRFSNTTEEVPAAAQYVAFGRLKNELMHKTEAAICEGRVYMESMSAARRGNPESSEKQKRAHEQEERWLESMRQHEADLIASLEAAPGTNGANSSVGVFKKALERHREAVLAFTTALLNNWKEKTEEAIQEVEASTEHLRGLAREWKGSSLKQHEA